MDPKIANKDFRPPPQPGLPRRLLLAIVLVHVVVIAALLWQRGASHEIAPATPEQAASAPSPDPEQDQAASAVSETSPAPAAARTKCPSRPLLAAAGRKDGRSSPPARVSGKTDQDIEALLVAGKEAAAAGQVRDAEVAYLAACRLADAIKGPGSIESANARYQLARHYLAIATTAGAAPVAKRGGMLRQAQAFYSDSLQRFRAQWGDSHEKTRFAAEGLEAARMALAQTTPPAAGSDPMATAQMGAAPGVAESAPQRVASPKPSFDCRKARSYAERTICADPELAQLDRDLGRLYARAKKAADDPAAFRRESDVQWRRREKGCRDRDCLLRWYADRRQQLTEALSQSSAPSDRTAVR